SSSSPRRTGRTSRSATRTRRWTCRWRRRPAPCRGPRPPEPFLSYTRGTFSPVTTTRAGKVAYECDACGHRPPKWVGRCPECGEESVSQVRLRAERLGALHDRLYLAAETDLEALLGHLDAVRPGLLVVDSVQTITAPGTDGVPGGVTQVRAVTAALIAVAKERGIATVLVGHVTKDGQVAGPR